MKTQRFAGKVWFISGLAIMLLSFIQWVGVTVLALGIIFVVIVVPRVYSTAKYKKAYSNKNESQIRMDTLSCLWE